MTTLQKLVSTIKKRIVKPKVYAIELDCGVMAYLHLGMAYSLEEALQEASRALLKDPTKRQVEISAWHLRKYAFKPVDELINEASSLEILPGEVSMDKNQLMQRIVDEKNVDLFHENLSLFSVPERQILNDKLTDTEKKPPTRRKTK